MTQTLDRPASASETAYERNQRFNAVTRYLHGFRYRNIRGIFTGIQREIPDRPIRVIEIGCAHGKLYEVLSGEFRIDYLGIELNPEFHSAAVARYGSHPNFKALHGSATDFELYRGMSQPDVVCALETLEHIPEHDVVRIVEHVAALRPRLFVASVPVEVGPAIWVKNVASLLTGYNRHKSYRWSDTFFAGMYALNRVPPHGTGHRGFDWRWLAQTIRHNMRIRQIRRSPSQVIPSPLAFSVMFLAEPR